VKITWISPYGDGWSIARKLRSTAGHRVVLWSPTSRNGEGYLPLVSGGSWQDYAERSDLVVVDGNFPSRRTRRSWEASDEIVAIHQLRHRGVNVLGPTPATELMENDPRYFRKVARRADLRVVEDSTEGFPVTVSRDPAGLTSLIFRHRHLLGEGNGPEVGNLGDVVIPLPSNLPIFRQLNQLIERCLLGVAHQMHVNVDLVARQDHLYTSGIRCRFLYPAIFAQLAHLLDSGSPEVGQVGFALSVLNLDGHAANIHNELLDHGGVYPADVHRDFDGGEAVAHGTFVGAIVGIDASWQAARQKVYDEVARLHLRGLSFRTTVGDNILSHLNLLSEWGYL
jgi:hypothetical protein